MMKKLLCVLVVGVLGVAAAGAGLVERVVEYRDGDQVFEGFHVYDDTVAGKRPAVLVVHQWTGLSNYEKHRARMLAELGYNVFALDVYGKGVRPPAPGESGAEAGKYKRDRALFRDRLQCGLEVLLKDERTDATKVAAVGYCFGGTAVLEMARAGMPVAGVVSFHGGLAPADGFAATKRDAGLPKVLVLHGAVDPFAPLDEVVALSKEMEAAGADYQVVLYGRAVHSFTQPHAGNDPSRGAAYDADADRRSWQAMSSFLEEVF